ncbi:MAG: lytic transglycosylase domain-containing protein [Rhodobacteraceae bacterium]|nr:lytic transglycosylase domain-containing protein [Paracoccaceae bacterium]
MTAARNNATTRIWTARLRTTRLWTANIVFGISAWAWMSAAAYAAPPGARAMPPPKPDVPATVIAREEDPATPRVNGPILPIPKPPIPASALISRPAAAAMFGVRTEPRTLTQADRSALSQALTAAEGRRFDTARQIARKAAQPVVREITEWLVMRKAGPKIGFEERVAFLQDHADWPAAGELKRLAEDVAGDTAPTRAMADWFIRNPPATTAGKVAFARAARATGDDNLAVTTAKEAWITGRFDRTEERDFLKLFERDLSPADHKARLEHLLYAERRSEANRFLRQVDADSAAIARVRIALIGSAGNVDRMIAQLPERLRADPGIVFDRIKWRRRKGREESARELLPDVKDTYPRPDLWFKERDLLARDALEHGKFREAYTIITNYGATDAVSVSDAEWLAGWIALRHLGDGEAALAHFEKVYDTVQLAANLSRAAYWVGRSAEHLGRGDIADQWYRRGATYITTFYGQLSAARIKQGPVPLLPIDPLPTAEQRAAFDQKRLTLATRAIADLGESDYLRGFVLALAASSDFGVDRIMAANLANGLGRPDLGVWISRQAARERIAMINRGYPAVRLALPELPERALILGIMRQESNFDPEAQSGAGARGLMQLMPATARAVSRALRVRYSIDGLTSDPAFNAKLGSTYIQALIDDFDGSYLLAVAGYNAGPSRPRQWIARFGDPRKPDVDAVDWIEQIPFNETRNYVQRVLENMMVYRAILGGSQAVGRDLEQTLKIGATS